jgi:hypothetical protein
MLVSTNVPNLINGVSQQADNLRFPSQCNEQINALSSVTEGLTKRPPSQHIANLSATLGPDMFVSEIARGSGQPFLAVIYGGTSPSVKVFGLEGTEYPVKGPSGSTLTPSDLAYFQTASPKTSLSAYTVGDHTFVLNKDIAVAMGSPASPTRPHEALVFVKQYRGATDYTVHIYTDPDDGVADYTATLGGQPVTSGGVYNWTHEGGTSAAWDQGDLAGIIREALVAGSVESDFQVLHSGPLLYIKKNDGSDFRIEVTTTLPDGLTAIKGSIQNFSLLPKNGWSGFNVKVKGDPDTDGDEYYLTYTPDVASATSGFVNGHWQESRKPGLIDVFNGATLPHSITNHGDHFRVIPNAYEPRLVGDTDSNPPPSFVGKKIRSVFFWKNRLGFGAGENCILSEAGEFFNFWRTSVIQVLDSDPIDVATGSREINVVNHAVPVSERLVLFSDNTQTILQGGDLVTPKSVSTAQATELNNYANARPISLGPRIYFGFSRGGYTGISEYAIQSDTGEFDGEDISDHVPHYLDGNLEFIFGSDTEDVLFAKTEGLTNGIYIYKFYRRGNERLLSSWSKWVFNDPLRYAFLIESDLYLLIERSGRLMLEKVSLQSGRKDTNDTFVTCLDRRFSDEDLVVTYSTLTDRTTITLPFTLNASRAGVALRSTPEADGGDEVDIYSLAGTTLILQGDYRDVALWFGEKYEMLYTFSKPRLREKRNDGTFVVVPGRFQIRYGYIAFSNTLQFSVEVQLPDRPVSVREYAPRKVTQSVIGQALPPQEGVFRFPVYSKNEQAVITIKNNSTLPAAVLSVDWEALYTFRAQRI